MELKSSNITSQKYHDIFDFKLTKLELVKWKYKDINENTFGKKNKARVQREKYSNKKLVIAKKAAKLISKIPTVKFVGITGALAMNNAGKNSDIDLLIITKKNTLWSTRLCVYGLLRVTGYELRKPEQSNEKNRLCLNMWLDENDLVWDKKDRNIYTAHEIAQIVPLINKNKTYEKFLWKNKWILNYWPNSVKIQKLKYKKLLGSRSIIEKIAFNLQYFYMKSKITREVVTKTRAIFHPTDWGKVVMNKISS